MFPAFYTLIWGLVRQPAGGSITVIGQTIPLIIGGCKQGDVVTDGGKEPDVLEIWSEMREPTVFYAFGVEGKEHLGECGGYSLSNYIDRFFLFSVSKSTIEFKNYNDVNNIITCLDYKIMAISFSKSKIDLNNNHIVTMEGINSFSKLNRADII